MLGNSAVFLLNVVVGILSFLLILRFLMQWTRTSFQNPLGQMAIALTDFMVKPARRVVKHYKQWDLSTLLLAFVLQWLLIVLLSMLAGFSPLPLASLWHAVIAVLSQIVDVFFYAILLMAILSWVNPYNPIYGVLSQLTAPVLNPLRQHLPAIQGFDFSALVALVLLQLISRIILPGLAGAV